MKKQLLLIFSLASCISCNTNGRKEYTDTSTSGEIAIAVDETFEPIVDSQLATFHSYNKNAHITPYYVSETEAFQQLIQDSCRMIIAARELNAEEKKYFESIELRPRVVKIAIDAIALIANNDNADSILTYEQVTGIVNGTIKNWSEINSGSSLGEIHIVFDNSKSSTARYMKEKLLNGNAFPASCFAMNSNVEVINYCNLNKGALGIIGVNWISDGDDPASLDFKKKIKVMAIKPPASAEGAGRAYKPYQAYIAQGFYPFTREVFIISREARSGLASGFSAFVAGDKGQRIILKSGLMPATKPVRIVGFRNNE